MTLGFKTLATPFLLRSMRFRREYEISGERQPQKEVREEYTWYRSSYYRCVRNSSYINNHSLCSWILRVWNADRSHWGRFVYASFTFSLRWLEGWDWHPPEVLSHVCSEGREISAGEGPSGISRCLYPSPAPSPLPASVSR